MRIKVAKKEIMKNYKCFSVGYCDLQTLLGVANPQFYTAGVYGWNADIYIFGNIAIVTGYRPFGKQIDFDIIRKFEDAAIKNREKRDELLKELVSQLKERM